MSDSDAGSGQGTHRCDLCRNYPVDLRPVCVRGRETIPLLCSDCVIALETVGRLDRTRDREVFGYGA